MEGGTKAIGGRRRPLITPVKWVRKLQEGLHRSAKRDAQRRFHQLYDKVWNRWTLHVAWRRVRAKKGAPGPDGVKIKEIEARGVDAFLTELSEELRERRYRTGPIRRKYVPKPNGKLRPLGIPNVRDRVVQAAVLLVIEPIFEADLPDTAYGFRPRRKAHQALDAVREQLLKGRVEVVDADLQSYFDTIPHENLMALVARRIVDRGVLQLIQQWLSAAVIEPDGTNGPAGRTNDKGTPQGGVISPLLANLYHACIPHLWERRGHARQLGGKIISYADDFVILLSPGRGAKALAALRSICQRLALTLSEAKTQVVNAEQEAFQFLGFAVKKARNPKTGKRFPRVMPSAKGQQRSRDRIGKILNRKSAWKPVEDVVKEVNAVLRGWGRYFYYGMPQNAMRRMNHFAEQRLRKWLMRRKQRRGPGYAHYPTKTIYEKYGLHRLPTCSPLRHAKTCG